MILQWLKRKSLERRGLSSGKTRRLDQETDWRDVFDQNRPAHWSMLVLLFLAFVRIGAWASTAAAYETFALSVLLITLFLFLVPLVAKDVWKSNQLLLLTILCLIINLFVNKSIFLYTNDIKISGEQIPVLLLPSAFAPMLLTILISPSAGFITAFILSVSGILFIDATPGMFLSSLLTGLIAAQLSQHVRRRSDILMAGVKISFVGLACALLLGGVLDLADASTIRDKTHFLFVQAILAIALGVITSFIVLAILPVFEWLFDRITDISWVELADLKHPLLKQLADEAPGTFHHSLNVANLAESAAEAIGANPTQCRVCAYFHDIGKLDKPQYFTENIPPGQDPHASLTPSMSALIIINHVKDGIDRALKHGLRQPLIDVIKEHHGTSLVYYFFKRAQQQQQDARVGIKIMKLREEDIPAVDPGSFRYPGPIPQSKESAIISLADVVEGASRSLKNPTAQRVESFVREIIKGRIQEGQLDESCLTFNEISVITSRFIFTLKNMLHARPEYPSKNKKEKEKPANGQNGQHGQGQHPQPPAPQTPAPPTAPAN
ncbi:MAG: HDIG domain-containing protein [Verrucomicrobiales bacterium]|jgi:putative nucleotidyltransferase with HDIG domain|nr:HDIG domain-containing protein [Verrucomicrobiales bacterium]